MSSKVRILLVALMACGLVISAISIGAAQEKSILRVGFSWPTLIDPAVGSDYSSAATMVNLYDTLVYPAHGGGVIPHLAKSWVTEPLSATFELKEGVKFHDGSELTAEDVKFSMDRLLEIGEGSAYLFMGRIESTEVLGKYKVRFNLATPFGPFIPALARLHILNKDVVMANLKSDGPYGDYGDYGKEYLLTNDAGSGAYMVKEFDFEESILMEKFPDYFGHVAGNAPDEVLFMQSPDTVTVKTMMSRRELEMTDPWQPEEAYVAMDAMEGVEIARMLAGEMEYLMFHTRRPPTDDAHFRRALSYLLDYDQVTTSIFPGTLQSLGPIPHGLPGAKEGLFQYHYDLDRAREELQKSKYADRLDEVSVTLAMKAGDAASEKLSLMYQAACAEVGINMELVNVTWGQMVALAGNIDSDYNIIGIGVGADYAEAGSFLQSKYHSNTVGTWMQPEWVQEPLIDFLIEDAVGTIDKDERFEKYGLLQELVVNLAYSIFLVDPVLQYAYQAAYVNWPQQANPLFVMGFNHDCRFIEVLP